MLNGFIKRKVIKQTVMTTVYGVTKFGARLQIVKQLKGNFIDFFYITVIKRIFSLDTLLCFSDIDDFPKEHIWTASHYLTQKTFESIGEMFTSTKEIQDWLTECAKYNRLFNKKNYI